jgi:excisionase family DNA binding protein
MNKQTFFNRLTSTEVADILGVTDGTLAVWRCTKRYCLPFVKIGRKIFYRSEDVKAFVESRIYCKISNEDSMAEDNSNVFK